MEVETWKAECHHTVYNSAKNIGNQKSGRRMGFGDNVCSDMLSSICALKWYCPGLNIVLEMLHSHALIVRGLCQYDAILNRFLKHGAP